MWPFTKKVQQPPEYSQFIHQISEIGRLEMESQELYRFALDACQEIYKYSGNHDFYEKLEMMTKVRRAR